MVCFKSNISRFILKRGFALFESMPVANHVMMAKKFYFSVTNEANSGNSHTTDVLLHKTASVLRTFESSANAQAMLISGGSQLASNASFDPQYSRAKNYIRNHAVGPAVLSPILINGLIGALVESQFPQGFMKKCTLEQKLHLIVGCEVEASLMVVDVKRVGHLLNTHFCQFLPFQASW